MRKLFIKSLSWEYWPVWMVYFPVSFYFIYLSIKARSLFFFSASNPSIETGGMFFESKWEIFKLIPKAYFPPTIYVEGGDKMSTIQEQMVIAGIDFPVIAKPDRGERGWAVKKIHNIETLEAYKTALNVPFLIQTYINYPVELSVFYFRHPSQNNGVITSVTYKKLLTIIGDGRSSIGELIQQNDRSYLQYERLLKQHLIDFTYIPKANENVLLVPYGNHVLGTTFLNYNHIIDESLTHVFDDLSKQIDGFYFGRYDLRCASIEDLKMGKNFSILELNGAGAEPAHIYEPGFSYFKAQYIMAKHFKMMYSAARENNKRGVPYMSYKTFKHTKLLEKMYKRKVALVV
ncbi:MAG: hypothetical protein ACOYKE_10555 [Ferruginibacter sp.]